MAAMAAEQLLRQVPTLKCRYLADASELTREQWLELRRKGIGGSDTAPILGLSPYKSIFGIYVEKVEGSTFEGNIHTEFGNWMEPHIREEFPKRFFKAEGIDVAVFEYPYVLQHPTIDIFMANLDGVMEHPEYGTGIIEIKTASEMQWKQWQDDELPDSYYCQVQHYLNVTGLDYAYIVALVGKKLLWKYISRNDEFISLVSERLIDFWNTYIIPKEAPSPMGLDDDADILKKLYGKEAAGKLVDLPDHQNDYDRYKEIAKEVKELEQEQEAIKQKFMQAMGDCEVAFIGKKKVTWKTTERKGYVVQPTSYRSLRVY